VASWPCLCDLSVSCCSFWPVRDFSHWLPAVFDFFLGLGSAFSFHRVFSCPLFIRRRFASAFTSSCVLPWSLFWRLSSFFRGLKPFPAHRPSTSVAYRGPDFSAWDPGLNPFLFPPNTRCFSCHCASSPVDGHIPPDRGSLRTSLFPGGCWVPLPRSSWFHSSADGAAVVCPA